MPIGVVPSSFLAKYIGSTPREAVTIVHHKYINDCYYRVELPYAGLGAAAFFSVTGQVVIYPNTPISGRKVLLLERKSGRLVKTAFTDINGNYTFSRVHGGPWLVLAIDHTGVYNAVAIDSVTVTRDV